jgi:hypothetical protein
VTTLGAELHIRLILDRWNSHSRWLRTHLKAHRNASIVISDSGTNTTIDAGGPHWSAFEGTL